MIQAATVSKTVRCAIYTRKSHEEGLEQEFNSLDAQREAAESYIASQRHEGWIALPADYSDGGFSGGTMERPALQKLMADIERGRVDCIVVYKVDRLSRSLMDFAKLVTLFDQHEVSFVSVTQQFNTTTSMGRLTLNILLSFAQFEREIIGERIRDKKLASAMKGKYIGGQPFLGYDIDREKKRLLVNPAEADMVRQIFESFIETKSCLAVARELNAKDHHTKEYKAIKNGKIAGGKRWNKVYVYRVLTNRKYLGEVVHKGKSYPGEHEPIVDRKIWDQVQRIMADNYHVRSMKIRQKAPALLKGILRCGHCGKLMGAGHTKRRGRRYRYYICNHAQRNGYDACPIRSVAAGQIETAVKDRIRIILRSPDMIAKTFRQVQAQSDREREELDGQKKRLETRLEELKRAVGRLAKSDTKDGMLADELRKLNEEYSETQNRLAEISHTLDTLDSSGPTEDDVRDALQKLDPLWDELFPAEKERIVKLLVEEVVASKDNLLIRLRLHGIKSLVAELQGNAAAELQGDGPVESAKDGQTVDIRVPMEFKVRSGRKEITLPEGMGNPGESESTLHRPLVVALAKAFRWQKMMESGQVKSLEELGKQEGVNRSYVRRILWLATLAPDIVKAILAGTEPSGLSLRMLNKNIPPIWDKQRKMFGFAGNGND
ncbi:MAG: recombinase family protein [Planctomycetes bacterium]|nr:recombinase family protein [Planctomycetota bacterium]